MMAAFPSDECKIFDYNRVIKDLNGLSQKMNSSKSCLKILNCYRTE